jgi:hypothetical protein
MKQSNLSSRSTRNARRIAGHAQEDHILGPYQLSRSCVRARHAGNVAPFTTTGAGHGKRGLRALTSNCVRRVGGSMIIFLLLS